jgi:hypothetical protein
MRLSAAAPEATFGEDGLAEGVGFEPFSALSQGTGKAHGPVHA